MNRIFSTLKTGIICLLSVIVGMISFSDVVNATEALESSVVAVVVIEDYSVVGGPLEAGKDVRIALTLHNTSKNVAATSILMTVSSASGLIYPSYGQDNQFFIGTISAGASETVEIPISVSQNYSAEAVDLTCNFEYASLSTKMSNSATIVIPTSGGNSVEVKSINVSSHATVHGESLLSINYVNRTNEKIIDAELIVSGNVSADSKNIKLDDIRAGKSYSEDCRITFTQAGDQEIEVVFAYTDIDGTRVETNLGKYSVEVEENQTVAEDDGNAETMLWVGRGISVLAFILAVILIVIYIKRR